MCTIYIYIYIYSIDCTVSQVESIHILIPTQVVTQMSPAKVAAMFTKLKDPSAWAPHRQCPESHLTVSDILEFHLRSQGLGMMKCD